MRIRNIISAGMLVMALGVVPALSAYQAEDATKTTAKKVKKSAKATEDTATKADTSATETVKKTKAAPVKTVPESEITAAKASGKVWVNTDTGVYHKGGQWYGATKQGKFMTEEDAIKAGYHVAKTK